MAKEIKYGAEARAALEKGVNQLADTIRKAFRIAKMGRPGPVLIDIPKDVTAKKAEYEKENPGVYNREFTHIDEKEVAAAAEMIQASEKPFIFVGGGAILSGASKELKEFVEKTDAPVTDSLMGKGAFPGTDPIYRNAGNARNEGIQLWSQRVRPVSGSRCKIQ